MYGIIGMICRRTEAATVWRRLRRWRHWRYLPINPGGQWQVNPFTWSSHVPLCSHGLLIHSLISVPQVSSAKETWTLTKKDQVDTNFCINSAKTFKLLSQLQLKLLWECAYLLAALIICMNDLQKARSRNRTRTTMKMTTLTIFTCKSGWTMTCKSTYFILTRSIVFTRITITFVDIRSTSIVCNGKETRKLIKRPILL